jgi:hypothetical protein
MIVPEKIRPETIAPPKPLQSGSLNVTGISPTTVVNELIKIGWLLARSGSEDDEAVALLVKAHQINPESFGLTVYATSIMPIVMNSPSTHNRIQARVREQIQIDS